MTKDAVTSARMVCRPGMSVRDTSQPIGAATRQQITAEVVAMIAVVSRGSRKAGSVNSVTKFCSVGCRALSVNAKTASHDIGNTISTIMKAANSHSTGLVQSMRDFGVSVAVMVMRSTSLSLRHSGAMRSIEPEISRCPDVRRSWFEVGASRHPGMTAVTVADRILKP